MGTKVVMALERVAKQCGYPRMVSVGNASECASKAFDAWADALGVQLDFIRPSTPAENTVIESFNGQFRKEYLETRCLFHRPMHESRLKRDGSITMNTGCMVRLGTQRPRNLPNRRLKTGWREHRIYGT